MISDVTCMVDSVHGYLKITLSSYGLVHVTQATRVLAQRIMVISQSILSQLLDAAEVCVDFKQNQKP